MNKIKYPLAVLAVDDNEDLLELIGQELEYRFEKIYRVSDVNMAKAILHNNKIDVVVSDFQMPEQSGADLLKWIRIDKRMSTPFILLTGNATDKKALEVFKYNAFNIIDKPYISEVLINSIFHAFIFQHYLKISGLENTEIHTTEKILNQILSIQLKKVS